MTKTGTHRTRAPRRHSIHAPLEKLNDKPNVKAQYLSSKLGQLNSYDCNSLTYCSQKLKDRIQHLEAIHTNYMK